MSVGQALPTSAQRQDVRRRASVVRCAGTGNEQPIGSDYDLTCSDFGQFCGWRNEPNNLGTDNLDFAQGMGTWDPQRGAQAFGTPFDSQPACECRCPAWPTSSAPVVCSRSVGGDGHVAGERQLDGAPRERPDQLPGERGLPYVQVTLLAACASLD